MKMIKILVANFVCGMMVANAAVRTSDSSRHILDSVRSAHQRGGGTVVL